MSGAETVEVPRALLEQVLDRIDDLEAELQGYRAENEKDKASIRQRVTEAVESSADHAEDADDDGQEKTRDLLPIERLLKMGERGVTAEVTASVERAKAIAKHFPEWSKKTPKGHVVKENLRSLLQTATGERLHWKQVYRAAEALEEFTRGLVRFEKSRRHGWMLVGEPSVVQTLRGHMSSVPEG